MKIVKDKTLIFFFLIPAFLGISCIFGADPKAFTPSGFIVPFSQERQISWGGLWEPIKRKESSFSHECYVGSEINHYDLMKILMDKKSVNTKNKIKYCLRKCTSSLDEYRLYFVCSLPEETINKVIFDMKLVVIYDEDKWLYYLKTPYLNFLKQKLLKKEEVSDEDIRFEELDELIKEYFDQQDFMVYLASGKKVPSTTFKEHQVQLDIKDCHLKEVKGLVQKGYSLPKNNKSEYIDLSLNEMQEREEEKRKERIEEARAQDKRMRTNWLGGN